MVLILLTYHNDNENHEVLCVLPEHAPPTKEGGVSKTKSKIRQTHSLQNHGGLQKKQATQMLQNNE